MQCAAKRMAVLLQSSSAEFVPTVELRSDWLTTLETTLPSRQRMSCARVENNSEMHVYNLRELRNMHNWDRGHASVFEDWANG